MRLPLGTLVRVRVTNVHTDSIGTSYSFEEIVATVMGTWRWDVIPEVDSGTRVNEWGNDPNGKDAACSTGYLLLSSDPRHGVLCETWGAFETQRWWDEDKVTRTETRACPLFKGEP